MAMLAGHRAALLSADFFETAASVLWPYFSSYTFLSINFIARLHKELLATLLCAGSRAHRITGNV